MTGCSGNGNGNSPASAMGHQTVTEKKFGGIAPKKPLISKVRYCVNVHYQAWLPTHSIAMDLFNHCRFIKIIIEEAVALVLLLFSETNT
uniref:Uncharacterized protein n=1 Tax=Triticum urartu TaxID=4572 RepID=A0A8R7PA95_TRIUA